MEERIHGRQQPERQHLERPAAVSDADGRTRRYGERRRAYEDGRPAQRSNGQTEADRVERDDDTKEA